MTTVVEHMIKAFTGLSDDEKREFTKQAIGNAREWLE